MVLDSDASHLIQMGLQEQTAVDLSRHKLRGAAGSHKCYVGYADKSQDGVEVGIDEIKCSHRSSCLVDPARRSQNGSLFAREETLGAVCTPINKGASAANHLVNPQLDDRGNAEIVHGHAEHVLVCLLQFGDAFL